MVEKMILNYFKTKKVKNKGDQTLVFGLKKDGDEFFIELKPNESKSLVAIANFLKTAQIELSEND